MASLASVPVRGVLFAHGDVAGAAAGRVGVRVFSGTDAGGRPTQVRRTVHGTKKDARRVAAELTLKPSNAAGRTVGGLVVAWVDINADTWAPSTLRDQTLGRPGGGSTSHRLVGGGSAG